jgi:lysophospholipase L1-like esterase
MTDPDRSGRTASQTDRSRPSRRLAAAFLAFATLAATTAAHAAIDAALPSHCKVADDTALVDGPLPRLAKRLAGPGPVTIVVLGSGSAAGSGTSRRDAAFPYRLESRLSKAFPKAKLQLVVLASTGQTAPAVHARFAREVVPLKPALVVWQTGSADLAGGVSVTEFETALEHGIPELRTAGGDVILVDGQFSPRASLLMNTDAYRDAVRWNARRYELPLFKRYDTMQSWWHDGVFDLDAQDKASQLETADRIHDCVAAVLTRAIVRGVGEVRS